MARKIAIPAPGMSGEQRSMWDSGETAEAAPEQTELVKTDAIEEQEPEQQESRQRDEQGRFASESQDESEGHEESSGEVNEDGGESVGDGTDEQSPEVSEPEPDPAQIALEGRLRRAERNNNKYKQEIENLRKEFQEAQDKWFADFEAMRNPEPDKNAYPEEHREWEMEQLRNEVERMKKGPQEQQKPQQADYSDLNEWMYEQEEVDPNFNGAFQYLFDNMKSELVNSGESEESAAAMVQAIGYREAQRLMDTGGSWTKYVMHHAKQRGYENGSGEKQVAQQPQQKDTKAKAAEDLTRISKGKKAAGTGGRAPSSAEQQLTKDQIAAIPDKAKRVEAFKQRYKGRTSQSTFMRPW